MGYGPTTPARASRRREDDLTAAHGPPILNIQATHTGRSVSARGMDDEGVPADMADHRRRHLITRRRANRRPGSRITGVKRSHGCSFADSVEQRQFQRMPNIRCAGERDITLDDIVADTERGILIKNRGFGRSTTSATTSVSGQAFYEVRNENHRYTQGRRLPEQHSRVLKMDRIGGRSYWLGGTFTGRQGEPSQASSVSHGCPPARFAT